MTWPSTRFEVELTQQSGAARAFLERDYDLLLRAARLLSNESLEYVAVVGRGSSLNAAHYARYLIGTRLGLPVVICAPSLTTSYGVPVVPASAHAVVIGISQSGVSPDVVAVLQSARGGGVPTVAITNDTSSPLADAADVVLGLAVGEEGAVSATKTYTTSLVAIASLVAEACHDRAAREELRRLPELMEETVTNSFAAVERLDRFLGTPAAVIIGRGYNYATAREIALKMREVAAKVAEAFSPAAFMHGPIAAVTDKTTVLVVRPRGKVLGSLLEAEGRLRSGGITTLVITDAADGDLRLPGDVPEWVSPIVAVIPGQVLALRHGLLGGRPVDSPAGMEKITRTY